MSFLFALVCGILLLARPTAAANCVFTGAVSNDFNTAGNWTCGQVPTGADDVWIGAASTTSLSANTTVQNISASGTINAVSFTLNVTSSVTVISGGSVTSTSGSLLFQAVTSTGTIGTQSGIITVTSTVQNNGRFDIGTGTATTTGNFTNGASGILNGGSGILAFLADFTNSGTFNPQGGTVRVAGTAAQSIAGAIYKNFASIKTSGTATFSASSTVTGALNANGNGGTLSSAANDLSIAGTTSILTGATVTSTSGVLTFVGTVTSTGSLGSNSGNQFFTTTFTNTNGTFNVGSGTATTTGALTGGTVNGNSGTLSVLGDFSVTTFNAGTGTFRVAGGSNQSLSGNMTYGTFVSIKTGGTATFTSDQNITGTLTTSGGGTLSADSATILTVTGAATIGSGTTVTSTASNSSWTFNGTVSSTGSIGSSAGNVVFGTTFQNNGTFNAGTGTATSTGALTNAVSGTINGNAGTFVIVTSWTNNGTFSRQSGTVRFAGTAAQTVPPLAYNNIVIRTTGGDATIVATTTASGTTQVVSGSTFAISTSTYTGTGLFTNTGTITLGTGGKIIHTAESTKLTDGSGTEVTSYATAGSPATIIYVTVQDSNRNLLGATIETMQVTVALDATAGSDSETLTLTETAASSGIFRNAIPANLIPATSISIPGSGEFELVATGVGTLTYTDSQDASDIGTDTATFSKTVASTSNGTTGGGGGGSTIPGSSGISASGYATTPSNPPPITVTATPEGTGGADFVDPNNLSLLLATYGLTANATLVTSCKSVVRADAQSFGLTLTAEQETAMCHFVVYGVSRETIKFGSGERRAILRDYFDTMRRANVAWSDIQRMTTGRIMIVRNHSEEQRRVAVILPVYQKIYGHAPNFQDANENLAWNTMQYRLRFPRDIAKEATGIARFRLLFGHIPSTPFGWSVVRVLGYIR